MASETNFIYSSNRETVKSSPNKIVYIKADKNYSDMFFDSGKNHTFSLQLDEIKNLLEDQLEEKAEQFMRVGKSLIINLNYIFKIEPAKKKLELCDNHRQHYELEASTEALKKLKKHIET